MNHSNVSIVEFGNDEGVAPISTARICKEWAAQMSLLAAIFEKQAWYNHIHYII